MPPDREYLNSLQVTTHNSHQADLRSRLVEAPGETGVKESEGDMGLELTEATVYLQYRLDHIRPHNGDSP